MSGTDARLLELAARVADGEAIDWEDEQTRSEGGAEVNALRGLRMLQELVEPSCPDALHDAGATGTATRAAPPGAPTLPGPPTGRLGDFELVREIGRGGMGVVYEARQISLQRRVALKVLPTGLGLSPEGLGRFEREARAAAALHHTNIVPVYAIGEDQGFHFYAMELIEGASLSRILEDVTGSHPDDSTRALLATVGVEALPAAPTGADAGADASLSATDATGRRWFDAMARLLADVADALHHAHARGIVHRDVKPANLLLATDGRLCLTDFGLARVTEEPRLTVSGAFLGTPAYMSPEQIAAGKAPLDHRTDIYSLGAVLYEALTLQRPFPGASREQVISSVLTTEPRPPRKINRRIPSDLETICAKAMEKEPARRYQTAAVLADDLRNYLHHGPITAKRAGPLRRFAKCMQRHPVATTVVAAAIVSAVLGAWGLSVWSAGRQAAAAQALSEAQFLAAQGSSLEALRRVDMALAAAPALTEARLLRARLLIEAHRPEEALADADRLLARDANDWAAHLIKAVALRGRGGVEAQAGASIAEHLAVVEARAPETPDAFYLRALAETDHARAIALLDRALDLDPAQGDALAARVRHQIALKHYAAAALDAERLKVARPRSSAGRRLLALVYFDRLDCPAALAEIEAAIAREPGEAENWWTRGEILLRRHGDREQILAAYARAVELRPDSALFHVGKGRAHAAHGEHDAALAEYEAALRLDPAHLEASDGLINELRALARVDEARRTAFNLVDRTAAWSDPRDRARAVRIAVRGLVRLGDPAAARPLADQALALDPASFDGYIARAQVRADMGAADGALADCVAAAQRPVSGIDELQERSSALIELCGRADLALADADRLVERAPEWPAAWEMSAIVYFMLGRAEEGIARARRAVELAPNDYSIHNTMGCALGRKYLWEEEAAEQTRALEIYPQSATALFNRGGFPYRYLGRVEEGLADLEQADALSPGDEWIGWARSIFLAHLGRCEEAHAIWQGMAERGLYSSTIFEDRAQVYAISFWPRCRSLVDLPRLVEDGRQAVARASASRLGTAQLALGAALYRSGRFGEAHAALREGLALVLLRQNTIEDEQDENGGRYLLAMAAARLGRMDEARREFARALERARVTRREKDPDLVALRREAEGILGLTR